MITIISNTIYVVRRFSSPDVVETWRQPRVTSSYSRLMSEKLVTFSSTTVMRFVPLDTYRLTQEVRPSGKPSLQRRRHHPSADVHPTLNLSTDEGQWLLERKSRFTFSYQWPWKEWLFRCSIIRRQDELRISWSWRFLLTLHSDDEMIQPTSASLTF